MSSAADGTYCDATIRADGGCNAWGPDWPWHGCIHEPDHATRRRPSNHKCRCGREWSSRGFVDA